MLPPPDPQEFDGCHTADLLAQARLGDASAWDGIYQRYRMRLLLDARAQLRRRRIPGQGTEDIVQSAFLAAWSQIQRFEYRGEGSFRAWLRTLVVNRVLDRLRRSYLEQRHHEADAPEGIATLQEDPGDGPLAQVEHTDSVQRLLAGLEGLPELERDIVVMRAFEHKRWAEIAECCERSRTFVEKHYKLAFKRLARCLGVPPVGLGGESPRADRAPAGADGAESEDEGIAPG